MIEIKMSTEIKLCMSRRTCSVRRIVRENVWRYSRHFYALSSKMRMQET